MTAPSETLHPSDSVHPGQSSIDPGIDFDGIFAEIADRLTREKEERLAPPLVRLWDGDMNLRGIVRQENSANFQFLDNETGTGALELPLDYYMSKWIADVHGRDTTNIHITVDKDGARWSGRMDEFKIVKTDTGQKLMRVLFKHDYEELKHILCWSNPFLPAEIQFPRLWILFGRVKWALETTLLVNIMRLESSLWMLPDDPMDPAQWFNFDQSTWSMVVKPSAATVDNSPGGIVHSRFKNFHDLAKSIVEDAELSIECRRFLEGDEPPWPGADLRHGCLVWEIVDKSARNTGTSFGGSVFDGLVHQFVHVDSNGLDESMVGVDPNMPDVYKQAGYMGTVPAAPWVIFREGDLTGIQSSEFSWKPATDVGVVTGGHSAPGVNEAIGAAIQMIGNLTALIPAIGVPIGGVADTLLKPLYTDTILAFMKWKSPARAQRLGWSHYHEKWGEGADRAYTLSSLLSLRSGFWQTREYTRHTLVVADGSPYRVGQKGFGHFFLGDRVGSTVLGMPDEGLVFVDRVSELTLGWDRTSSPSWQITIGQREPEDAVMKALAAVQEIVSILKDLGLT